MKRMLLYCLLALCLLTVPAALCETPVTAVSWDSLRAEAQADGLTFRTFIYDALGLQIDIPDLMTRVQVSPEDQEEGVLDRFIIDDNDDHILVIKLSPLGDLRTLEDLEAFLRENYASISAGYGVYNGLNALVFADSASGIVTCCMVSDDARFLQFTFSPVSDPVVGSLVRYVFGSLRPLDASRSGK